MKEVCEMPFNANRKAECDQQRESFSSMTGMFGAGSHSSGMRSVCDCVASKEEAKERYHAFVLDLYEKHGPAEKANSEFVEKLLAKFSGKEYSLIFTLYKKYGKGFVAKGGSVPLDFRIESGVELLQLQLDAESLHDDEEL